MPERNIEKAPPTGSESLSWGTADSTATIFAAILSLLVFFFPNLQPAIVKSSLFYQILFAAAIIASPFILRLCVFFGEKLLILLRKGIWYDTVADNFKKQLNASAEELAKQREASGKELLMQRQATDQAEELVAQLRQQVFAKRQFEIKIVQFYDEQVYILVLKRSGSHKLKTGDLLVVADGGKKLGDFEVREDRAKEYLAKNIKDLEPVWSGYIRDQANQGSMETLPPPECMALFIPQTESEENND